MKYNAAAFRYNNYYTANVQSADYQHVLCKCLALRLYIKRCYTSILHRLSLSQTSMSTQPGHPLWTFIVCDQIQTIRDDVEYYIDSNQEADFEENEFLYDELDLEDLGVTIRPDPVASSPTDSNEVESLAGSSSPPMITPPSSHSKVCEVIFVLCCECFFSVSRNVGFRTLGVSLISQIGAFFTAVTCDAFFAAKVAD